MLKQRILKTNFVFSILFIHLFCSFNAQAQWQWVDKTETCPDSECGDSRTLAIASSKYGDTYATGIFKYKAIFQKFILKSDGNQSPFLIKYATNGSVKWALAIETSGTGYGNAIAIDDKENVYVTGTFSGKACFDTNTYLTNNDNSQSLFIAKYNKDGYLLWAKKEGAFIPTGIAADSFGKITITGSFGGQQSIGNMFLQSAGSGDIFLAQYNTDGKLVWAQRSGTNSQDIAQAIAVDNTGFIYLTGSIANAAFLAKYDSNGNSKWINVTKSSNSPAVSKGTGVVCDEFGNCYITGSFNCNINFGYGIMLPNGYYDQDVFIAKYSATGKVLWAEHAGGHSNSGDIPMYDDEGLGIAIDKSGKGNVLITGYFESDCKFGNQTINCTGEQDVFIATYTYNGILKSVVTAYGTFAERSFCISTDAFDNFYMGGYLTNDPLDGSYFGSLNIIGNLGLRDAYIGKYHISETNSISRNATLTMDYKTTPTSIKETGCAKVYPNPASSELNIEIFVSKKGSLDIKITDQSGRMIYLKRAENVSGICQEKIWIKDYPAGLYYLKITDATGEQTIKFIKE